MALNFRPDLLLMDVIMPWMDGGTVVAEIREEESLRNVAVIFLTSILNKDEAAAHGNRMGKDPVLARSRCGMARFLHVEPAFVRGAICVSRRTGVMEGAADPWISGVR